MRIRIIPTPFGNKYLFFMTIIKLNKTKIEELLKRISEALFNANRNIYSDYFIEEYDMVKEIFYKEIFNNFNEEQARIVTMCNEQRAKYYSPIVVGMEFINISLSQYPQIGFNNEFLFHPKGDYDSDRYLFEVVYEIGNNLSNYRPFDKHLLFSALI